jgi:protein ImuB
VLTADLRGKPRVVAVCAEGARRGITGGMALAQAKALAADLVAAPWDEERLARAAREVTAALLVASPRVAWERGRMDEWASGRARNEGVWWVDAAGLGEETRLAQRLLRTAKALGYGPVRVGIADSAIAAYAATFRSPALPRSHAPTRTRIVPSGRDAAFLAPYPLALLDLDEDLAETLAALGLTTVARLAALESGEVEARFGPEGLAAHRLALGTDPRGPSTPRDDTLPTAACDLGGAVATAEPLLFVLKGALARIGEGLRSKGLAARELTITLTLDDGSRAERAVRPARPTSHEDALFDHCRAALEDWALPEPVVAFALAASLTAPAAGEQGDLLAARWADPAALEAAFDRIRGREGSAAVATPLARDGHLPQDAGAWSTDGARSSGRAVAERVVRPAGRRGPWAPRAVALHPAAAPPGAALLRLEAPAPVRVRLGRSGLEAFRHGDLWYDVTAWSGPERLAGRWWRDDAPAKPRDYFTARTASGALWVLFRTAKQWFVEGWWD